MDRSGKLSLEDKQKIIDLIFHKKQSRSNETTECEICQTNQWMLGDHLIYPNTFVPGGALTLGGATYPFVQLNCTNCGHTRILNAVVLGFLDPGKAIEPDEKDAT